MLERDDSSSIDDDHIESMMLPSPSMEYDSRYIVTAAALTEAEARSKKNAAARRSISERHRKFSVATSTSVFSQIGW